MDNKNMLKGGFYLLTILVILIYGFSHFNDPINKFKKLVKSNLVTNGKIVKFSHVAKNGGVLYIEGNFILNNIKYKTSAVYTFGFLKTYKYGELFYNKTFPVLYYPSDPTNNSILIFPEQFKNYNIPYPDSLNWVKQYIHEDE